MRQTRRRKTNPRLNYMLTNGCRSVTTQTCHSMCRQRCRLQQVYSLQLTHVSYIMTHVSYIMRPMVFNAEKEELIDV